MHSLSVFDHMTTERSLLITPITTYGGYRINSSHVIKHRERMHISPCLAWNKQSVFDHMTTERSLLITPITTYGGYRINTNNTKQVENVLFLKTKISFMTFNYPF